MKFKLASNLLTQPSALKTVFCVYAATFVTAVAAPITVSNFSFESPTGSAPNGVLDPANGSIGLWNYTRSGVLAPTLTDVTFGTSALATDGTHIAGLTFLVGAVGTLDLNQDVGVTLAPNSTYTLRFDADQASLATLLTGARVSITAGGVPQSSLSGGSLLSLLNGTGGLDPVALQLTTGAIAPSGNLGIEFEVGGVAEVLGAGVLLDNVRLDVAPVPEPSIPALTMLSAGMLLAWRRLVKSSN